MFAPATLKGKKKSRFTMRSKFAGFLLFTAVSLLYQAKIARATPASGFAATTLAKGQLAQFEVF